MPKFEADWMEELSLKQLLDARGQTHARVGAHGDLPIVESGPAEDAVPHVRFRRQGVHIWTLELPSHTDRWNKTPYRGPMEAMLDVLEHEIPWVLAPVDGDPQATSGTPYWMLLPLSQEIDVVAAEVLAEALCWHERATGAVRRRLAKLERHQKQRIV